MTEDNLESGNSEASDVDLLSEDQSPDSELETGETEEETPEEETSDETSETEESDEEVSDEDEPEEEVEEPTRPSWKTIKEKYPELTKDKDFREMFHREKAFSEVFPTVEDAREASEKVQVLDSFDSALAEGDVGYLVNSLNDKTLATFTDKVLPSLREANPKLFFRATRPVMVEMLQSVVARAEGSQDENLKKSAQNIAKYLFGTTEIPKGNPKEVPPEIEEERNKLKQERSNLFQQQRSEFFGTAENSIAKQLKKIVSEGINPDNTLTDFVVESIINKTLNETKATLLSDQAFVSKVQQLARQAEKNGFPPDFKPRIISAYLGRAKQLALTLRAKHKSAAIGKKAPVSKTRIEAKGSSNTGKTTQTSNTKRKSDLDIINEGA
jgi:hypothetical protein